MTILSILGATKHAALFRAIAIHADLPITEVGTNFGDFPQPLIFACTIMQASLFRLDCHVQNVVDQEHTSCMCPS